MDKEAVISKIKKYLRRRDDITFAFIFGSFVRAKVFRDIDIAVYFEAEPELMQLGIFQSELTKLTGQKVDLVPLNGLPCKNPAFVHEIVTHGELLFSTNEEKLAYYKRKALLFYLDTAKLREDIEQAFYKRLESGKFGRRNYA